MRGYKKDLTYRGFNIYVSKTNFVYAVPADGAQRVELAVASTDTTDGEIFGLVDQHLEAKGY